MSLKGDIDKDQSFDYKLIVIKALSYWYLFLIALMISGAYAWYSVRYAIPSYRVTARILLKDEYSSWGQEYFLSGLELVSARNRLVNEVGAIRSFPLMRKVLEELPKFKVSYYGVGDIKTTELYGSAPFFVRWDTIVNPKVYGRNMYIKVLSANTFSLSPSKDDEVAATEYNFEEPFDLYGNEVTIGLKDRYSLQAFEDKLLSFKINNLDRMAIAFQRGLGITPEKKESSILVLSRNGTCIEKEMDFINKFIEVYITDGLEKNNLIATNVMSFVDDRINDLLDTLILAEGDLERFKSQSNLDRVDLQGEQLIPQIAELERERMDLEFNLNYFQQLIEYTKEGNDARGIVIPDFIDRSNVLFGMVQSLVELYGEKMQLKYDVTTTNDNWIRLNEKIRVAKDMLAVNLESMVARANAELALIKKEIQFIEFKLGHNPSVERSYLNIQREYKLNNDLYTYLLTKKAEASIAKGSKVSNVTVLDWATMYRVSYVGPNTGNIYVKSMLSGLVIVGLLVFLLEYFNERIRDENDIASCTNIPVLSLIGHNLEDSDIVVIKKPKSIIAESFRSLRTSISYLVEGKENFCIMISSSVSREGKTFCTINLASAFAILGKRTVILGADMRKPKIFQDFGLTNEVGMSNYLIGKAGLDEITQATQHDNIFLVSAGPVPPNPSELIGSKKMNELMKELRANFDIIIIDTPPLGLVTDALQLTKYADANLYIVRHNVTKRSQLKLIDEIYRDKKIERIGIVVNDFVQAKIAYNYSYGYGYGYGYGSNYGYGDEPPPRKSLINRIFY